MHYTTYMLRNGQIARPHNAAYVPTQAASLTMNEALAISDLKHTHRDLATRVHKMRPSCGIWVLVQAHAK